MLGLFKKRTEKKAAISIKKMIEKSFQLFTTGQKKATWIAQSKKG